MRVAVVTGAASGIGEALCRELARRGARIVAADVDGAGAERVAAELGGTAARVDVTDASAVADLAERTWAREGRVDLWVNNAGIAIGGPTEALELADWHRVLAVNLAGVVHGVHAIYPRMVARGDGHIVNMASVAGLAPYPMALPYVTSKHAVVGLSQALRAEARSRGVRVSVACPGAVRTPIWERSVVRGPLAAARDRLLSRLPQLDVARCAAAIADGIAANRAVIPVTLEAQLAWRVTRAAPGLAGWISHRIASSLLGK